MLGGRNMSAYTNSAALPLATLVEPGTAAYIASPPSVQMSNGVIWQSIGAGIVRIVADDMARPSASSVALGTLIYVQSPTSPTEQLQIGDGSSWIGIA
jgi:hypothetical protein